jgi:probable F420-dependent oxidoreductase
MPTKESGTAVEAARKALGPVGTYLPIELTAHPAVELQREAAARLERAGYGAVWTNETVGGKDALVQLAVLMAATERLAFGTGIANIWARPPQTARAAAGQLAQAYPGRLVLGIGVGYAQQAEAVGRELGRPVATMRDYLDRMGTETVPPALDAPFARILAANRPKMLELARERADGALPVFQPAAATAQARATLGPDKLLVVALSVIFDGRDPADQEAVREQARASVAASLARPWYADSIKSFGFTERQIADVDDELVDAIVAHGTPDAIAASVRAHLDAGADHVVLLPPGTADLPTGVDRLERLAPAVIDG